jgi:hypothetical protein
LKLLTEAQKAKVEVSKLLLQASKVSSHTYQLCKQVNFLKGHTKKIVKGKLNSLEAFYRAGINLLEGLSFLLTITLPSLSCQCSFFSQLLKFFASFQTSAPFFENRKDIV